MKIIRVNVTLSDCIDRALKLSILIACTILKGFDAGDSRGRTDGQKDRGFDPLGAA
jgi:hypothetical protein